MRFQYPFLNRQEVKIVIIAIITVIAIPLIIIDGLLVAVGQIIAVLAIGLAIIAFICLMASSY